MTATSESEVTEINVIGYNCSPHVHDIIASSAQALYALRVLRAHGLCGSALQTIYRAVIVSKLIYAISSWTGFSNATDQQKIQVFINRSKNAGFCNTELDDFALLYTKADKDLFAKVLNSPDHVLHPLLPPHAQQNTTI